MILHSTLLQILSRFKSDTSCCFYNFSSSAASDSGITSITVYTQKRHPKARPHGFSRNNWPFYQIFVIHDDVITWKHFPRYWPFVRGIHRSPVNSPHKGQWRGALMFSLICVWINGWLNNRGAGDSRRYRAHCDVAEMDIYRAVIDSPTNTSTPWPSWWFPDSWRHK